MDRNVTLKVFPKEPSLFQDDIAPIVGECIFCHGMAEWRAVVLTLELHRHLGVYAIVGAKMGIRAMEILGCKSHELQIKSFAGSVPPLSCLNDGLQAATGATLGHGNIEIDSTTPHLPKVRFSKKGQELEMELDPKIRAKVELRLGQLSAHYGFATKEYWQAVRRLAIEYWRDLDRKEIFSIPIKHR